MFNVVLVEPEIPQNTGNIARLCAAADLQLIIVGKPGFVLHDSHLKRAGLDYWVDIAVLGEVVLALEFEPDFVVGSTAHLLRLFEEIPSVHLAAKPE